jgi:hypothetical protein
MTKDGRNVMDATLNALAYKLRAEISDQAAHHPEIYLQEVHRMRYRLGSLIVSVGQKLQEGERQVQTLCDSDANDCVQAVG